jgi:hypothetical protein
VTFEGVELVAKLELAMHDVWRTGWSWALQSAVEMQLMLFQAKANFWRRIKGRSIAIYYRWEKKAFPTYQNQDCGLRLLRAWSSCACLVFNGNLEKWKQSRYRTSLAENYFGQKTKRNGVNSIQLKSKNADGCVNRRKWYIEADLSPTPAKLSDARRKPTH